MSDARTCIEKLLSASILRPVSLIRAFRHTVHCSFLSPSLSLFSLFIYREPEVPECVYGNLDMKIVDVNIILRGYSAFLSLSLSLSLYFFLVVSQSYPPRSINSINIIHDTRPVGFITNSVRYLFHAEHEMPSLLVIPTVSGRILLP